VHFAAFTNRAWQAVRSHILWFLSMNDFTAD